MVKINIKSIDLIIRKQAILTLISNKKIIQLFRQISLRTVMYPNQTLKTIFSKTPRSPLQLLFFYFIYTFCGRAISFEEPTYVVSHQMH